MCIRDSKEGQATWMRETTWDQGHVQSGTRGGAKRYFMLLCRAGKHYFGDCVPQNDYDGEAGIWKTFKRSADEDTARRRSCWSGASTYVPGLDEAVSLSPGVPGAHGPKKSRRQRRKERGKLLVAPMRCYVTSRIEAY